METDKATALNTLARLIQLGSVTLEAVNAQIFDGKGILIEVKDERDFPGQTVCRILELSLEDAITTAYNQAVAFYRMNYRMPGQDKHE